VASQIRQSLEQEQVVAPSESFVGFVASLRWRETDNRPHAPIRMDHQGPCKFFGNNFSTDPVGLVKTVRLLIGTGQPSKCPTIFETFVDARNRTATTSTGPARDRRNSRDTGKRNGILFQIALKIGSAKCHAGGDHGTSASPGPKGEVSGSGQIDQNEIEKVVFKLKWRAFDGSSASGWVKFKEYRYWLPGRKTEKTRR